MTLNSSRWIVRLFFWSVGILDEFTDSNRRFWIEQRGTNLCFFCQTTFIWTPLVLLLHVLVYGALGAALTVVPMRVIGVGSYAAVVIGTVALVLVVVGLNELMDWRRRRRWGRPSFDFKEERGPSTVGIAWQWLVAQKRKVCPMISFTSGARG
jgi:hypothetical protein